MLTPGIGEGAAGRAVAPRPRSAAMVADVKQGGSRATLAATVHWLPARTGRGSTEVTAQVGKGGGPLVLHVVPTPRGRGGQLGARMLADRLDEPGLVQHRLLDLFAGRPEVAVDFTLDHPGGDRPAEGFEPRVALRLRKMLARLDPAVVVAHGGDAMKYAVPAVIGTRRSLVYCVIGTYAGPSTPLRQWGWRRIMARAGLVVAVGDEVLDECRERFRVPPQRVVMIPYGRDPSEYRPRSGPPGSADATLLFLGALTTGKQPDRFVEVVGRLHAEGRTVNAMMVGDGPLAGTLTPMATAQGIEVLGAALGRARALSPRRRVRVPEPAHR